MSHGWRPSWAAFLLAAVALAGCSDDGSGDERTDPTLSSTLGAATGADARALPTWAVGDYWVYTNGEGTESDFIVTADQGADWFLDTSSADTAFFNARNDVSRLGPVRKDDLAGSQGTDRVEFFRWPLAGGETWKTRWDGQDVTVKARDAGNGVFAFAASNATGLFYSYTYDARLRWFGEINRHAADGSVDFSLKQKSNGHDFAGTIVRWNLAEVASGAGGAGTTAAMNFEVPAGTTDIWAEYSFTCTGAAGWSFFVQPVNPGLAAQQGDMGFGPCAQVDVVGPVQEAPQPGTWVYVVSVGGETVQYRFTILLRTRQDIAFP